MALMILVLLNLNQVEAHNLDDGLKLSAKLVHLKGEDLFHLFTPWVLFMKGIA